MSLLDKASLIVTPNAVKASKLYSVIPVDGSGDMTVVRSTTATRINSSGLIESVAANVPRLDYTNGTCPTLLVEPQKTNSLLYSEQFNNSVWNLASTSTVTLNSGIAPDNTNTANLLTATASDGRRIQSLALAAGTYTYSYFVKKGNQSVVQVLAYNSTTSLTAQSADFNLDTGTLSSGTGTIQQFTNGWYRVSITFTLASSGTIFFYIKTGIALNAIGSTVYAWGAQLELNSYATSYIQTTATAVTRNADLISKTAISSLIGQTEGTLFCDVYLNTRTAYSYFAIAPDITLTPSYLGILLSNNVIGFESVVSGALQASIQLSNSSTGRFKIAAAYKLNDFVLYINGSQIGTDTSGTIPTCSQLGLNAYSTVPTINYNSAQIYKTRLTNTELQSLTTL
jgi:hypothetical protein